MIFKLKMFCVLICVFCIYYTQGQNNLKRIHWFDTDSIPLCDIYKKCGNPDSITYIKLNGEKINVNTKIKYIGGIESLLAFCDSAYYNRPDYNYQELNATAYYSILFDENLHIQEIRIYKRLGYDCSYYDYDKMIKGILLKTEGKWIKTNISSTEWQFYFGRFKLR